MAKSDKKMAEKSAKEERGAIKTYGKRLGKASSPTLKKALQHAKGDEEEHEAAFEHAASITGMSKEEAKEYAKGMKR